MQIQSVGEAVYAVVRERRRRSLEKIGSVDHQSPRNLKFQIRDSYPLVIFA
jgi:hypothetical protein